MDETATPYGVIVVIKRDGSDGARFPLTNERCIFGRGQDCDIRIQLPNVSVEHCEIRVDLVDEKLYLMNMDGSTKTILNGVPISGKEPLSHLDVFTVSDRSFRCELPTGDPGSNTTAASSPSAALSNIQKDVQTGSGLTKNGVMTEPVASGTPSSCIPGGVTASGRVKQSGGSNTSARSTQKVAANGRSMIVTPLKMSGLATDSSPARSLQSKTKSPSRVLSPARVITPMRTTSPARNIGATSPARSVSAVSPARNVGAVSPARNVGAVSPARNVGAMSPARNVGAVSPARNVGAVSPARNVCAVSPARNVCAVSPARNVGARSPARNVGAVSPARNVGTVSPARNVCAMSPARNIGAMSSKRMGGTTSPARTAVGIPGSAKSGGTLSCAKVDAFSKPQSPARHISPARLDTPKLPSSPARLEKFHKSASTTQHVTPKIIPVSPARSFYSASKSGSQTDRNTMRNLPDTLSSVKKKMGYVTPTVTPVRSVQSSLAQMTNSAGVKNSANKNVSSVKNAKMNGTPMLSNIQAKGESTVIKPNKLETPVALLSSSALAGQAGKKSRNNTPKSTSKTAMTITDQDQAEEAVEGSSKFSSKRASVGKGKKLEKSRNSIGDANQSYVYESSAGLNIDISSQTQVTSTTLETSMSKGLASRRSRSLQRHSLKGAGEEVVAVSNERRSLKGAGEEVVAVSSERRSLKGAGEEVVAVSEAVSHVTSENKAERSWSVPRVEGGRGAVRKSRSMSPSKVGGGNVKKRISLVETQAALNDSIQNVSLASEEKDLTYSFEVPNQSGDDSTREVKTPAKGLQLLDKSVNSVKASLSMTVSDPAADSSMVTQSSGKKLVNRRSQSLSPGSAKAVGKENVYTKSMRKSVDSASSPDVQMQKLFGSSPDVHQSPVTVMTVVSSSNSPSSTGKRTKSAADTSSYDLFAVVSTPAAATNSAAKSKRGQSASLIQSPKSGRVSLTGSSPTTNVVNTSSASENSCLQSPSLLKSRPSPKPRKSSLLKSTVQSPTILSPRGRKSQSFEIVSSTTKIRESPASPRLPMQKKSPIKSRRSFEKKSSPLKKSGMKKISPRAAKSASKVNDGATFGSPNPKSLKLSIGMLRRKSQPVFELEESDASDSVVSPTQGETLRGTKRLAGSPIVGSVRKKRNVSFGPEMSPEIFDRTLPVCTPLRRGAKAVPRRRSSATSDLKADCEVKPLLKRKSLNVMSASLSAGVVSPLTSTQRIQSPQRLINKVSPGRKSFGATSSQKALISGLSPVTNVSSSADRASPNSSLNKSVNAGSTSSGRIASPTSANRSSIAHKSTVSPLAMASRRSSSAQLSPRVTSPQQKMSDSLTRPPLRGSESSASSGRRASTGSSSDTPATSVNREKDLSATRLSLTRPPLRRQSSASSVNSISPKVRSPALKSPGLRSPDSSSPGIRSPGSRSLSDSRRSLVKTPDSSPDGVASPQSLKLTSTPRPRFGMRESPKAMSGKKHSVSPTRKRSLTPRGNSPKQQPISPLVNTGQVTSDNYLVDSDRRVSAISSLKVNSASRKKLSGSWNSPLVGLSPAVSRLSTGKNCSHDLYSFDSNPESPPAPRRVSKAFTPGLSAPNSAKARKSSTPPVLQKSPKLASPAVQEIIRDTLQHLTTPTSEKSPTGTRLGLKHVSSININKRLTKTSPRKKVVKNVQRRSLNSSVADAEPAVVSALGIAEKTPTASTESATSVSEEKKQKKNQSEGGRKFGANPLCNSEPRARVVSKIAGKALHTSPDDVVSRKKATPKMSRKMISERYIDLSSVNIVTPKIVYENSSNKVLSSSVAMSSTAVAMRALYGKNQPLDSLSPTVAVAVSSTRKSQKSLDVGSPSRKRSVSGKRSVDIDVLVRSDAKDKSSATASKRQRAASQSGRQKGAGKKQSPRRYSLPVGLKKGNTKQLNTSALSSSLVEFNNEIQASKKKGRSPANNESVSNISMTSLKDNKVVMDKMSTVRKSGSRKIINTSLRVGQSGAQKSFNWSLNISRSNAKGNMSGLKKGIKSGVKKSTVKKKLWSEVVSQRALVSTKKTVKPVALQMAKKIKKAKTMQLTKKTEGGGKRKPTGSTRGRKPREDRHADAPDTIVIGRVKRFVNSSKKTSASTKKKGKKADAEKDEMNLEYSDVPPTPNGPGEMLVSPWTSRSSASTSKRATHRVFRSLDLSSGALDISGIHPMSKSPDVHPPLLTGIKRLVKTPKPRKVDKSPAFNGVRKLLKTPKQQKSPQLNGVRKLLKTPKQQKTPTLRGIKKLVKTPKVQKSPALQGIKTLLKTPKVQKSPVLAGVRNLMKTPKVRQSPSYIGVRKLVKTPKVPASPVYDGLVDLLDAGESVETVQFNTSATLASPSSKVSTPKIGDKKSKQTSDVMEEITSPKKVGRVSKKKGASIEEEVRSAGKRKNQKSPVVASALDLTTTNSRKRKLISESPLPKKMRKVKGTLEDEQDGAVQPEIVTAETQIASSEPATPGSKKRRVKAAASPVDATDTLTTQASKRTRGKNLPKSPVKKLVRQQKKGASTDTADLDSEVLESNIETGKTRGRRGQVQLDTEIPTASKGRSNKKVVSKDAKVEEVDLDTFSGTEEIVVPESHVHAKSRGKKVSKEEPMQSDVLNVSQGSTAASKQVVKRGRSSHKVVGWADPLLEPNFVSPVSRRGRRQVSSSKVLPEPSPKVKRGRKIVQSEASVKDAAENLDVIASPKQPVNHRKAAANLGSPIQRSFGEALSGGESSSDLQNTTSPKKRANQRKNSAKSVTNENSVSVAAVNDSTPATIEVSPLKAVKRRGRNANKNISVVKSPVKRNANKNVSVVKSPVKKIARGRSAKSEVEALPVKEAGRRGKRSAKDDVILELETTTTAAVEATPLKNVGRRGKNSLKNITPKPISPMKQVAAGESTMKTVEASPVKPVGRRGRKSAKDTSTELKSPVKQISVGRKSAKESSKELKSPVKQISVGRRSAKESSKELKSPAKLVGRKSVKGAAERSPKKSIRRGKKAVSESEAENIDVPVTSSSVKSAGSKRSLPPSERVVEEPVSKQAKVGRKVKETVSAAQSTATSRSTKKPAAKVVPSPAAKRSTRTSRR